MATLNKRRIDIPGSVSSFTRRKSVIFKLHLSRLAGIGRNSSKVHDVFSFFAMLISLAYAAMAKLVSVIGHVFGRVAAKVSVYLEPLVERFDKVSARIRLIWLREQSRNWVRPRFIPVLLLVVVTMAIYTTSFLSANLKVAINGTTVGYVSSKSDMDIILAEVEEQISDYLGTPYVLNLDVSYSIGYDDGTRSIDKDLISSYVMSSLGDVSTKYVMTVDGQAIGANKSKTALELLRQRMLEQNAKSYKGGKIEFLQDIQVVPMNAAMEVSELSIDEIQGKLTGNTRESVTYTVQSGDTVSGIAQKYGTTVAAIQANNPGLKTDKISIGDTMVISASVPLLSVKETVTESYVKRIGYDTIKETTDDLYTTQSRVKTAGVYGEADVVADVVYVDGVEESRTVMQWTVTKEPSAEVVQVGTKKPPAKSATGNFMKPSNGVFSSGFGYRKSLGDYHTGVDFSGAVGTSIYASDGGKVTFAGWKGSYGYCVFIDHNNGFVTVYAHCSKLLVKQGQSVAKGETIARVGSTGRSTGPHVHFEIRKNGTPVNPLNYIKK